MKKLIYVPIIHTGADMGSLAKDVVKRGIADLGEECWKEHERTVDEFWDVITNYFDSIDVSGVKIYQDGMIAEGEISEKIVEEGVKAGSRNYQLVSKLIKRGAILVKTEDFSLVKEERDRLLVMIQTKSTIKKIIGFFKYKFLKLLLLKKRDKFIVKRISETLNVGEKGILFIGAYHNIKNLLPKNFLVVEIKNTEKIKEYHRMLPFCNKNTRRFEELSKYLVSKAEV